MVTCNRCSQNFFIRNVDEVFYEKFGVGVPKLCPNCRMKQRMNFRDERNLYKRTSSLSQKGIISIYHSSAPYPVYSAEEWWSDGWDGLNYGQNFDFSRPFFEQFQELLLKIPRIGLFNINPENSDYCQQAYDNRNCYLCTVIKDCEDCMYISHTNRAQDSYDLDYVQNVQLSIGCLDGDKLYGCIDSQSCQNSSGLIFCYDLVGCQDCFGCYGLRNKKNYIFNESYTSEEYKEKIKSFQINKYSNYIDQKRRFKDFLKQSYKRATWNINTLSSLGNYLINTKNCYFCFDSFEIEDSAYCTCIFESHDIQDVYGMGTSEWVYNSLGVENLSNSAFCTFVSDSSDVFYSDCCFHSMNLFGCAGLKHTKNCILNKQYSHDEYTALRDKIIAHMKSTGEWGQFFPVELSPFGYDESVAVEHFPLSREEALNQGLRWSGYEEAISDAERKVSSAELSDDIADVTDDILTWAIKCEKTGKLFKIQKKELDFYRELQIPIPRFHPNQRYMERMVLRNPTKLYQRNCYSCGKQMVTTYNSNMPDKVLCEDCYREQLR